MVGNGLGYEQLRGLALNFTSTHQTENPRGFSEVGENKQLLIAIVVCSYFFINSVNGRISIEFDSNFSIASFST